MNYAPKPQDIQNMRINTPETEVYRAITGDNGGGNGTTEPFTAYGESGLATGKTRKQNLLSKAGRAMEAAQVNATRKETRDIGIENSGELVNQVRQRTGIADLETQFPIIVRAICQIFAYYNLYRASDSSLRWFFRLDAME